jgi:hypothetical protein
MLAIGGQVFLRGGRYPFVKNFHRIGDSRLQQPESGLVCVDRSSTAAAPTLGEIQG